MICYAMVKSKKNEIRKFQTKLKLNIRTIPTNQDFLKKKCFKLLFKKKKKPKTLVRYETLPITMTLSLNPIVSVILMMIR